MKLNLWILALCVTAATAAPAAKKGGGGGGGGHHTGGSGGGGGGHHTGGQVSVHQTHSHGGGATKTHTTKSAHTTVSKSTKSTATGVSTSTSSKSKSKSAATTSTSSKSKSAATTSTSSGSAATTSSASKSTSTASTSSSSVNKAAWPTHPVDSADIPSAAQIKAQKPVSLKDLPDLGKDYYTGPHLPSNFSTPGKTHAQAESELAAAQPPENVGGKPQSVSPTKLDLPKRAPAPATPTGKASGKKGKVFSKDGKRKKQCPKSAKDVIPYLTKPVKHEAMFYSAVDQYEYKFADQKKLALVKPNLDASYEYINGNCDGFWDHASEAWAQVSSGDVLVLLPDVTLSSVDAQKDKSSWPLPQWPLTRTGKTSIWEKLEWPALKANKKVCRVFRINKAGDKPMLLMVRKGAECSYVNSI